MGERSAFGGCRVSIPVACMLGVDPGLSGALAFYSPDAPHLIAVYDMPVVNGEVDAAAVKRRLEQLRPTMAIIERVGAMPKQGLSSTFKFGVGYGKVQGVVAALGIRAEFVTPASWKRFYRLPADKEAARAKAIHLWPASDRFELKKHSGRAEAALIARYAAETLGSHQVGTVQIGRAA